MIRKLITRVAIVAGALFCIAAAGVGITAYLALEVPSFYADLRDQNTCSESAKAELQQMAHDFERWAAMAVAHQRAAHRDESANLEKIASTETHTIRLTEHLLNAELASGRSGAGDLREVRVQLLNNQLRFGAELSVQNSKMILSATLTPVIGEDGKLHLTINRTGLGRLPLPHTTLLKWLSAYAGVSTGKMRLDVSGETPQLIVDVTGHSHKTVSVRSVQVQEGALAIEFGAPYRNAAAADVDQLAKR